MLIGLSPESITSIALLLAMLRCHEGRSAEHGYQMRPLAARILQVNTQENADQINFDRRSNVARIFCSRCAGFVDIFRNRGRFFSFYASFEAYCGAFRTASPTMGVVRPLTMYKLLKANKVLSLALFFARPL